MGICCFCLDTSFPFLLPVGECSPYSLSRANPMPGTPYRLLTRVGPQRLVLEQAYVSEFSSKILLPQLREGLLIVLVTLLELLNWEMWGLGYRLSSYLPFSKSPSWGVRKRKPALIIEFETIDPAAPKTSYTLLPFDFPFMWASKYSPTPLILIWVDFYYLQLKELWFNMFP